MSGPLSGVRVVDCTTVVLGRWAAQQLGDLGADVVKVEPPEGDTTRQLGPMRNRDMGAFYLAVNRHKRSIVLDLKQESARRVLLRLAEGALVPGYPLLLRPGPVRDRRGLSIPPRALGA
jgi:crotonobetainyl-CoA:carnitine CoA-transferase CaiB-like acyl-CoA transferase